MAQLEATVTDLNKLLPSFTRRNLNLIGKLDRVLECHRTGDPSVAKLDRKSQLIIAHLKEDLAKQTYELIDLHIRKLDAILGKFDNVDDPKAKALIQGINDETRLLHTKRGGKEDDGIDPSEPTYCICNQVAFGEMIECDNPDCEKEWFHVQCVGKPENTQEWYCPDCSRQRAG